MLLGPLLALVLHLARGSLALAQAPSATATATATATVAPPPPPAPKPPPSPEVDALREREAELRALMKGTLDLAIEPPDLFEGLDLSKATAIAVEVRRIEAVLAAAKRDVEARTRAEKAAEGGGGGGGGGGGAPPELPPLDPEEQALWEAQLALDRAKLDFLSASVEQRTQWLDQHRERQLQANEAQKKQQQAEAQKREAEAALEAAREAERRAQNEAQRRVTGEIRRLAEIRVQNSQYLDSLLQRERALETPLETLLKRERKVEELLETRSVDTAVADGLYVDVDQALSSRRAELAARLKIYAANETEVVPVGEDPLADLTLVDTSQVTTERGEVAAEAAKIRITERDLLAREVDVLVQVTRGLNRLRLRLLPLVPESRRAPLFDFGAKGRAQANAELDLLATVLRYHFAVSTKWVQRLPETDPEDRIAASWHAFKIIAALLLFYLWTRRAESLLTSWRQREIELSRKNRKRRSLEGFVRFVQRVRRSVELLVLFLVVRALLPDRATKLDEVQLVEIVLWWTLGEVVVVNLVNAIFARQRRLQGTTDEKINALRLKSLHFVGRWVVVFGLTLGLTEQLVGRGTIHHWVKLVNMYSTIPVFAVVLHWWRPIIFKRIEGMGAKNAVLAWVGKHHTGALAYPAAALGASYLLARSVYRILRGYLGGYELVRRALAYWFRRELSKKNEGKTTEDLRPLTGPAYDAFDPERLAEVIVPSVADPQLDDVIRRIDLPGGGVYAIVGERGAGKSSLLRRIQESCKTRFIDCPENVDTFFALLREAYDQPRDVAQDALVDAVEQLGDDTALLIDDAHHLIRPEIGGLDDFERVLELARLSSVHACTWVFCLDSVIFQYFERARGARPLFDDVIALSHWSEEGITRLLRQRTESAGLQPRFERLLREHELGGDASERHQALQRAEVNYYRLLWDYANGNPGVALQFWRDSLCLDDEDRCWVRLFEPPSTSDIESLPDEAIFVLRAVVQLELARVPDIAAATMLTESRIRDALRYALARGYVTERAGRYRVEWRWFRAITSVLQRRHLLTSR